MELLWLTTRAVLKLKIMGVRFVVVLIGNAHMENYTLTTSTNLE